MNHFLCYQKLVTLIFSYILCIVFFVKTGNTQDNKFLENNYIKKEYRIPMRDGKKLFTSVYSPKDLSVTYPIILWRTPYSLIPYGENKYVVYRRETWHHFTEEGYIIVFQDVRGRYMSEGNFENMRPHIRNKRLLTDVDESSDAYDTIEWLINNITNNNGRVGMWGISYPGFYAAMAAIDAHPALIAVSPQAPIADWFTGDDVHHNGAFSIAPNFRFFFGYRFGIPRPELVSESPEEYAFPTTDGYQFYLDMGSAINAKNNYIGEDVPFWDDIIEHNTYDQFWKSRSSLPHFRDIKPAIMIVGGWFDAENAYGALQTYYSIEQKNPESENILVMGPWYHGGWVRSDGSKLGDIEFGSTTGEYYVKNIELPFFNYYLKGKGKLDLPEAYVFETGSNLWKTYNDWPPAQCKQTKLYLNKNQTLSFSAPSFDENYFDEYPSDPQNPVPYTSQITTEVPKSFMVEDQRFLNNRDDVLSYKSKVLDEELTIAGPINVDIFVSTSGSDSDWIIKLIDVFPDREDVKQDKNLSGYQMLLRGEIMRGKFRNSLEKPEPMEPQKIARIQFTMNDLNHTFKKGHKIMVQVQSSWFPFFDRNPQQFVDIYRAEKSDYLKTRQRIYISKNHPSGLVLNILE